MISVIIVFSKPKSVFVEVADNKTGDGLLLLGRLGHQKLPQQMIAQGFLRCDKGIKSRCIFILGLITDPAGCIVFTQIDTPVPGEWCPAFPSGTAAAVLWPFAAGGSWWAAALIWVVVVIQVPYYNLNSSPKYTRQAASLFAIFCGEPDSIISPSHNI